MIELDPDIEKKLQHLESSEKEHLNLASLTIKAYDGAVYPFDLFIHAVYKRSLSIIFGYTALIRIHNFISAASLIRLHLDTLLRLSASTYVEDPHNFAIRVLDGEEIRNIKDISGAKMTDRRLVTMIASNFPGIDELYSHTCGYIHLSDRHIFNAMKVTDKKSRTIQVNIGSYDETVPRRILLEATHSMIELTRIILHYLKVWYETKDNPPKDMTVRNEFLKQYGLKK